MSDQDLALIGVEDAYPLTAVQAGMLYHSLAEPERGAYLGQVTALLAHDVDLSAFRGAWETIIRRHGALRTQFVWEGLDEPVQVVREEAAPRWAQLDWRHLDPEAERRALDDYLDATRRKGLDLAQAPAMELALMQRADGRHHFVWTCHHALVDDWSAAIVLREVAEAYACRGPGGEPESAGVPFRAFMGWLAGRDAMAAEAYWQEVVKDFGTPTRLQTPHVEVRDEKTESFRTLETALSEEASRRLRDLATSLRVTLSDLVTTGWSIVLHRCCGQDDVMFGVAHTQRPPELPGIEGAVGNFVTTLPARVRLDRQESLRDLILARQQQSLASRDHDAISLSSVQRLSGFPSNQPLFDTIVALEQGTLDGAVVQTEGEALFADLRARDQSHFPLALLVFPGVRIGLRLIHDPARYDEATARSILSMVEVAISALPGHLDGAPSELPVLTDAQRADVEAGETAPEPLPHFGMVHEEFILRSRATPEAPAVVFDEEVLSYGALDQRSEAWARRLLDRGLGPGDRVAVFLEPGPDVIVAILAALRSGCAYVPLDARYPSERLALMFEDCGAAMVLTDSAHQADLPPGAPPALLLDAPYGEAETRVAALPSVSAEDTAYVIYTSGSTGGPKGVLVTHGNLSASTAARLVVYDDTPKAFLLLSSFSFDSSVAGIFWALSTGGALVLPHGNAEKDMARLGEIVAGSGVTHTLCLPSLYEMILEYVPPERLASLRTVITAGEELPRALVALHQQRLPGVGLFNEYGPTEATVWCTAFEVKDLGPTGRVPIGRPIPGARVVLLDSRKRPVPDGLPAELYVGGAGVAAGYLGSSSATAAAFQPDPADPRHRLYRTGDIVRRRACGTLEFIGRADNQIKLRGYRIEPGEVEAVLARRSDVRQAVVVPHGAGAQAGLAAYIVPEPVQPPDREVLVAYARRMLPDWMVPSQFVLIDAVPRTANGKVNVDALPPPGRHRQEDAQVVLPRTPLERDLARIWQRVLWLDRELGVNEDFFELGGHSLLSIRLVNEIENELGLKLPIAALGRFTTVADQAGVLQSATAALPEDQETPSGPVDAADPFAGLREEEIHSIHAYTAGWTGEPGFEGSSILSLNRDGAKPPLFWCFNAAHEFAQMARHLGPEQPLYGLRSGYLILDLSPDIQQRENRRLALHYVRELLRIQPEGPYYIGGNCQGAAVAMELALVLQSLGQAVSLVILMEAVPVQAFHGRVALIFGRDSDVNPFAEFTDPDLGWRRRYLCYSADVIRGCHSEFFDEPNVQELCDVVAKRLAEAELDTPLPLPDAACRAEWLDVQGLAPLAPGERLLLRVGLRNSSRFGWGPTQESGLRLANRWLDPEGAVVVSQDGTTNIAARWPPGEERELELWITAPEQPGSWQLELDLVEEGIARFSARGAAPMVTAATVSPSQSPMLRAPGVDTTPIAPLTTPAGDERGDGFADRLARGRAALHHGNFDAGARLLASARDEVQPLFVELGECELGRGYFTKAEKNFRLALELDPENPAALYGLGRLRERQGRPWAALHLYRRCLALADDAALCRLAAAAENRVAPANRLARYFRRALDRRLRKSRKAVAFLRSRMQSLR